MPRHWSLTLMEGRAWIKREKIKDILDKGQRERWAVKAHVPWKQRTEQG